MHPVTTSSLLLTMKSSDDFTGHVPAANDIPDFESDPFRLLAKVEDKLIHVYHFNLQGQPIMTDSIKTALNEAGVTHTRHTYFDLTEFIADKLEHEQFRSNVANSMAWFCDTLTINAARSMFYRDYKESDGDGTQDAYNRFIDEFLNSIDLDGQGSEFTDGVARDIVSLMGFAPKMHDIASAAASATGRDYNPKSITQLLADEKPMQVNALTHAKLAQIAKFVEEDDEKAEAETLRMLLNKTELNAKDQHAARQKINPVIIGLIDKAEVHARHGIEFWELDKKLQERMVTQTLSAVKSTIERLTTYKTIDTIEFAMILKNSRAVLAELNDVLKTFRTPEEDATITAQQRAAKAKAKTSNAQDFEQAQADEAKAKEQSLADARARQALIDELIASGKTREEAEAELA